jgi:RNA polymerase sigma-70 factor (ECF subfamily)
MSSSKLQDAIGLTLPLNLPASRAASSLPVQQEVLRLFDECAAGLRRYVRSFGLDATATDDVLQDVFLSLFRHLHLERPRHNLKGWLFQVAHNLALKQRQRSRKRQQTEQTWDAAIVDHALDPGANPEERLVDDQRRTRLRAVVRALPERDRHCLFLRAEGLGYRDIAATLGISLGSVAKSLTRAMTRLINADRG